MTPRRCPGVGRPRPRWINGRLRPLKERSHRFKISESCTACQLCGRDYFASSPEEGRRSAFLAARRSGKSYLTIAECKRWSDRQRRKAGRRRVSPEQLAYAAKLLDEHVTWIGGP